MAGDPHAGGAPACARAATSATASAFRSQAATEQPSATSWRRSSRPIPEPPPVTTASLPLNESTARHLPGRAWPANTRPAMACPRAAAGHDGYPRCPRPSTHAVHGRGRATMRDMRVQRVSAVVAAGPRGRGSSWFRLTRTRRGGQGRASRGRHNRREAVRGTVSPDGSGGRSPWARRGCAIRASWPAGGDRRAGAGRSAAGRSGRGYALRWRPTRPRRRLRHAGAVLPQGLSPLDRRDHPPADLRAARIAEVVELRAAGVKERPRP